MQRTHRLSAPRALRIPAMLVVATMIAAACGSSSSKGGSAPSGSTTPTTQAPPPVSHASQQGVTDSTIKIGVAIVDFTPIQQFIDFNHGNEQEVTQTFINAINKKGGINGRKLQAVYMKYTPIGTTGPNQVCTTFTEDDHVFAVLGNIEDPTGAGQECVTKQHHTIMIGHDLTEAETNAAPGLMLSPDITAERRLNVLLNVLKKRNTLKGKKVAVLAETSTASTIKSTIDPGLKAMGISEGTPGVLNTGASTDTSAAEQQLQSFIERWKTEGVNAVLVTGADAVAKQFPPVLKKAMPNVLLLTDSESSAQQAAQDEDSAKVKPNPYEGMLTVNGLTDQQAFESPSYQACVTTYKYNGGNQPVIAPDQLKPGKDGKRVEVYVAISDICRELTMFQQIAGKVGKYLNNDNWVRTVDSFGPITNLPSSQYASITNGKYDADDTFALVSFSSKANDFVPVSPVVNAAG
ncbi:MAG TPA: ABC transporter substrate-binding protein [Acidimicrobiia bacterium]